MLEGHWPFGNGETYPCDVIDAEQHSSFWHVLGAPPWPRHMRAQRVWPLMQAPQQPSKGPSGLVEGHEPDQDGFTKPIARFELEHAATPVGIRKATKMKVRKRVDAMDVWLFRSLVQSLLCGRVSVECLRASTASGRRWHRRV